MKIATGLFNHVQSDHTSFIQNALRLQNLVRIAILRPHIHADLWLFVMVNVFHSSQFLLLRVLNSILLHRSIKIRVIFVMLGMQESQMMENIDVNLDLSLTKISLLVILKKKSLFVVIRHIQFQMNQNRQSLENILRVLNVVLTLKI